MLNSNPVALDFINSLYFAIDSKIPRKHCIQQQVHGRVRATSRERLQFRYYKPKTKYFVTECDPTRYTLFNERSISTTNCARQIFVPPPTGQIIKDTLARSTRAVLFIDVVDSVRLIARDESGTIQRWLDLVDTIERSILPIHKGDLVKSLGDGLLLTFPSVPLACKAAFEILDATDELNKEAVPEHRTALRMAIELGEVVRGGHDIYGQSVNLAARLMTSLSRPGEVVVTANARDQLTQDLDADVEDLGDCYLKGLDSPVRAYRIAPPQGLAPQQLAKRATRLQPAIAVIPLVARLSPPELDVLGEVIADEIIKTLARSQNLDVISRLSTSAFRNRGLSISEVGQHLDASYPQMLVMRDFRRRFGFHL